MEVRAFTSYLGSWKLFFNSASLHYLLNHYSTCELPTVSVKLSDVFRQK